MPLVHDAPYSPGSIARATYEGEPVARFLDRTASLHHEQSASLTDAERVVVMRAAAGFAKSLLHHD